MQKYEVANVTDAVQLAVRLEKEGKYDYFRGQTQDWPLRSSLQRQDDSSQRAALEWFQKFRIWVSNTEGLWPISADHDQSVAVAQHYGIPTNFIDFTSEARIAGFFATHERKTNAEPYCCILCLNSEELARFWRKRFLNYRRPELIRPKVPNLWRLEAQFGNFLFCPYSDFENYYPLDRIMFPYSGPIDGLKPNEVYPKNKSALEELLDQFFMVKSFSDFRGKVEGFVHDIHFQSPPLRYDPSRFKVGVLNRLPSWEDQEIRRWLYVGEEAYHSTVVSTTIPFSIRWRTDPKVVSGELASEMLSSLRTHPSLRRQSISFQLQLDEDEVIEADKAWLAAKFGQLWDGLRRLPYADEEIAEGIGNCAAIWLARLQNIEQDVERSWEWKRAVERVFGEVLKVEFAQDDGSYSRAYVCETELRSIMRADLYDLLKPEFEQRFKGDIDSLLLDIHAPERLYDFRRLASLFATRLVPIQLLTREGSNQTIVFSPARLETFGRP